MANSKVQLADGTVLIDISEDTVSASTLLSGITAHDSSGEEVTGELFAVGDLWSSDRNVNPASVLGFGTWIKIRESKMTWGEMKKHTWGELKQDTWGHKLFGPVVYVWRRTA